jgi:hypothetical protein
LAEPLAIQRKPANPKRGGTVTRSFRIDEPAFKVLQEEAEKRSVSVNTLLNQLVVRYANFDRFLHRLHGFPIPGDVVKDLLQAIPDEKLKEIATQHGGYNECITYVFKGEFTLPAFLETMRTSFKHSPVEYNEVVRGSKRNLTLVHEMGSKYSLYLANSIKTTLEALGAKPRVDVTDGNTVVLEITY